MKTSFYQCSVYCHCFGKETNVDLFGTFFVSMGVCSMCRTEYVSRQVSMGRDETRNEMSIIRGPKAKAGKLISDVIMVFRA